MSQPWTHVAHSKAYPRVNEHYVEPVWVSERLFEEEHFTGDIYDPACGFGRIIESAVKAGYLAHGADLVDRRGRGDVQDFLLNNITTPNNIVSNPPFDIFEEFAKHALKRARNKVALIMPTARLNAARWLEELPLRRVWLLTPRPSMPPGSVITSGGKVGGGKSDYAWLVFDHSFANAPKITEMKWMHRDVPRKGNVRGADRNRTTAPDRHARAYATGG